jgi:transglutaminase-like putative cysteine protease
MSEIFNQAFQRMTRRARRARRLDRRTGALALALLASAACVAPMFATAGLAQTVAAQQTGGAITDGASFTLAIDNTLKVNADKSSEYVETRRYKVLSVAAVRQVSQLSADYVEGKQRFDVLAAFIEKADGTQVQVDPATFITRDAATGLNGMFELGHKVVTVAFPGVMVGDTVVLTTRTATSSDFSPWHLQWSVWLTRSVARAASTMQVIAPSSLPLKVGVRGDGLQLVTTAEGTETRHVITYRGAPSAPAEERMTSSLDRDPAIFVSLFKDQEDLGRVYWAAAREAIEVTPEIARLADDITRGIDDRRAQAQAISAWVKNNIRYVLVDLGDTAIVPHPAGAVLKNRYGDCKDHAALMSALLKAKGIAVEHVLINSSSGYVLPEAPVSEFDHVMLYLPEFAVYDDPTAQFSPFGVLGTGEYDKPVVHVSDSGAHRERIPAMRPEDHVSIRRTRLAVAADGVVSGETEFSGTGWFAFAGRSASATLQATGLERSVEERLRSANAPGKGRFEIGSLTDHANSWTARARFTYDERFKPGGNVAIPVGPGLQGRPGGELLLGPVLPGRKQPFTCFAGTQVEEIELTFADGLPLPKAIDGRRIETRSFVYSADYRLEDRILKVRREFVSRVPGQVCAPDVAADIAQPLRDVAASNKTQMAFAAPAAKSPAAPAGSDAREIRRTAVAGRPLNVDFLYALDPDCSSLGVAGVRIIDQPKHGKLTVEKGSGFPRYEEDNPREACNRRRSEGMRVTYQPEPAYLGPDSATIDVVYGDGRSSKLRYAIAVDPKPAPAEATRAAVAGQPMRLGFLTSIFPDCSANPVASMRVVEGPAHGEATLHEETEFTSFAKNDLRSACNTQKSDGLVVLYRSEQGYAGKDQVTVDVVYADGQEHSWRYAIDVK